MDLGTDGLLEEDQFLMEINLGNMEEDAGEWHEYWLLAIQTARQAKVLTDIGRTAITIDTG